MNYGLIHYGWQEEDDDDGNDHDENDYDHQREQQQRRKKASCRDLGFSWSLVFLLFP